MKGPHLFWEKEWGSINSESYCQHIVPLIQGWTRMHPELLFMQDNAPGHAAKATQQELVEREVPLIHWPPFSPDLNPIEAVSIYLICLHRWTAPFAAQPPTRPNTSAAERLRGHLPSQLVCLHGRTPSAAEPPTRLNASAAERLRGNLPSQPICLHGRNPSAAEPPMRLNASAAERLRSRMPLRAPASTAALPSRQEAAANTEAWLTAIISRYLPPTIQRREAVEQSETVEQRRETAERRREERVDALMCSFPMISPPHIPNCRGGL